MQNVGILELGLLVITTEVKYNLNLKIKYIKNLMSRGALGLEVCVR